MATDLKRTRYSRKILATRSLTADNKIKEQNIESIGDLSDDHEFLASYEICLNSLGLLFCLTLKRLFAVSFTTLYSRSLKRGWMDLFIRERRNLKSNINSIEKCFMLNRLISENAKNHTAFTQQLKQINQELKTFMTCDVTLPLDEEYLYVKIENYRNLQSQRRLFYISSEEAKQCPNILSLQRAFSTLSAQIMTFCLKNANNLDEKERNRLKRLLEHSFIIVLQPSTRECVAAVKYEKYGNHYEAKLDLRIICLLDTNEIDTHFDLSNIAVTLYSFDRQPDDTGETQIALEWKKRRILDSKGMERSFYYAEIQDIKLMKSESRSSRPFYSSKVCQLHFQLKIKTKILDFQHDITFISRPFGICSHSQYYPEYIAKVLIYEIEQIARETNGLISPLTLTESICRYHTRIAGIQPKPHTRDFIYQQLQTVYELNTMNSYATSINIYEDILSKIINQIETFVDHPYLSMMYYDNLFLGICDNQIDHQMKGTPDEPQILLRFNALTEHHVLQQASVRYIVHDGQLIKATFHNKAFVDEMCQMICESNSEKAKSVQILSAIPNHNFHDFSLYFDNELYRLSTISPSTKETYYPLIPVLWSTMRSKQMLSKTDSLASSDIQSSTSSISFINQTEKSIIKSSTTFNGIVTIQIDEFIHYLAEKLPKISIDFQQYTSSTTEQKQCLASNLLRDYLLTISEIQKSSSEISNK